MILKEYLELLSDLKTGVGLSNIHDQVDPFLCKLVENLTLNSLYIYILQILKKEPAHAFKIAREVIEKYKIPCNITTVYIVLYRLEHFGYVESEKAPDHKSKRIYYLTPEGEELLSRSMQILQEVPTWIETIIRGGRNDTDVLP